MKKKQNQRRKAHAGDIDVPRRTAPNGLRRRGKATPHNERYGTVLKEFDPLRDNGIERLCVRVLAHDKGRRLDIRKFVEQAATFTKAGVSLSHEEFEMLIATRRKILRLLQPNHD